ncbi:hypothetical protein UlMin_002848 [Ulmus minor]
MPALSLFDTPSELSTHLIPSSETTVRFAIGESPTSMQSFGIATLDEVFSLFLGVLLLWFFAKCFSPSLPRKEEDKKKIKSTLILFLEQLLFSFSSKGFGSSLFKAVANYIYNMQLLIFVFEPEITLEIKFDVIHTCLSTFFTSIIIVSEMHIRGDSPEKVEYIGMKNLINAVKGSVGLRNGKLLFGLEDNNYLELLWGAFDDIFMGGVSESIFQIDRNNGGFASIRTKDLWLVYFYEMNIGYIHFLTSIFICYQNFSAPEDLSAYDGLELHLKGDGRHYKLVVRTSSEWDALGYATGFDTVSGQWQSVARSVSDAPPFDPTNVLMFSKFEYDGKLNSTFVEGPFQLSVSSIWAYLKDPISPRFVYVGSARVTRPDRPGLDLSKQPLVARLNKELGYILTFKLKGEDLIRESGIPYAIVRPCALTEEHAGADLIFDQGDNITGKISRKEVACICIAALASPYALDKTFEVKSVLPFSEPFTVDLENPPLEKDYNIYFKNLKDGITRKEILL